MACLLRKLFVTPSNILYFRRCICVFVSRATFSVIISFMEYEKPATSKLLVCYWVKKKTVSFCFWSSTSYEDALVITHVNEVSFLPGWDLPLSATISVLQTQITGGLETVCPSWDTLPLHVGQLETLTVKNCFSWHCTLISVVKRSLQATTCSSLVRC